MLPTISIIFPTLNGKRLIRRVLASIKKQNYPQRKIETIVIDNASTDGTPEIIAREFPWVKLIKLPDNTGSAPPVTMGVKIAKGNYILATNDDVILEKNCLKELVKHILTDSRIGIVTGKMLDLRSPHQPLFFGFRLNPYLGYHTYDFSKTNQVRECDWAPGACIFASKKLFEQVGYFDNQYIYCGDDLDFCFQVRSFGYKIVYIPKAVYYHGFTRAKGQTGPSQATLFAHYRGKFRYALKNLTPLQIFTTLIAQITVGPAYTYLRFGHKTLLPLLKALAWNAKHFQETMKSRQKAKKKAKKFLSLPKSPNPLNSPRTPIFIALFISLIFGLPHLLIPYFLGGFKNYQPLAVNQVPLLTFEETWSYAAQAREVFDGRFLVSDYHLAEYQYSSPSLLFLSPLLVGSLARLAGSVGAAFVICDFLLPPIIFLVIYFFLLKLTSEPRLSQLGGVLILTANRLFQFVPPLTTGMAKALWQIFVIDGTETAPLEFSRLFHPQLVFLFLILHLYFLFLALKTPPRCPKDSSDGGGITANFTSEEWSKFRPCLRGGFWERCETRGLFSWSCILSALFLGSLFYSYFYYWTFVLAGEVVLFSVLLITNFAFLNTHLGKKDQRHSGSGRMPSPGCGRKAISTRLVLRQKNLARVKTLSLIMAMALLLSIPYWLLLLNFKSLPSSTNILERMGLEVGRIRNLARSAQYLFFALIFFKLIKKKDFSFWFLLSFLIGGIICLNLQLITGYTLQSWHWTLRALNPLSIIMLAYLFQTIALRRRGKTPRKSPETSGGGVAVPSLSRDMTPPRWKLKEAILTVLILIFLLRAFLLHAVVAKNTYQGYHLPKTTLEAFDWLNQNTPKDSVILTPSFETISFIPVYTHNHVFLPYGAATLASDEEIINRLLITYKIFNLKKANLGKILTYSGSGPCQEIQNRPGGNCVVDSDLLEQQAVTVLFALKYLKKNESLSSWSVVFELPKKVQEEILTAYEESLKKTELLPSDFRLDYLYYGPAERKITKKASFSQDKIFKEVFRSPDVTIYKVR